MAKVVKIGEQIPMTCAVVKHFTLDHLRVGDRVVVDQQTGDLRRMRDGDEWYATAVHDAAPGDLVTLLKDGILSYAPHAGTD